MGLRVPSTQPDIVAIDVANLAFRAAFRFQNYTTPLGRFSGHIFGSFRMINGLVNRFQKTGKRITLWFALEGGALTRTRLLPEYKANRPHDRTQVPTILKEVYEMVRLFPGVTWQHPKLEADDILSRLTYPALLDGKKIVIVTRDQDLWQLLGDPAISIWDKDHYVDHVHVLAHFGLRNAKAVALYKALFGDKGDNIPAAVPHLKKEKLIEAINTHDMVHPSDLYDYLAGDEQNITKSAVTKLRDNWKYVERNWKIVRLRRKGKIIPNKRVGPPTPAPLLTLLSTFACNSLARDAKDLWRK